MLAKDLLRGVSVQGAKELLLGDVTGVVTNSNAVRRGDMFICINGSHTDGHLYAEDAVRRGASVIVCERPVSAKVPAVTVENTRSAAAYAFSNLYGSPSDSMKMIAVTGTNGKTSVTFMIREILRAAGYRCGLIGTVRCMIGDDVTDIGGGSETTDTAAMTTPDPAILYRILAEMKKRGVTHVIMEASSHSLSQHKLDPIIPDVAVFMGLSPEHLDYHVTMENYFSAKSVLFRNAKRCIINGDDPYGLRLCETAAHNHIKTFAEHPRDTKNCVWCENVMCGRGEVEYVLCGNGVSIPVKCAMPGRFGLYNSLLASAAALECGVSQKTVSDAMTGFSGVPGRMETVARFGNMRVIRDFAHTPDALRGVLEITAKDSGGKVWLVFGCGGDRDPSKRPVMGKIASDMADHTVITSDNCRSENRNAIIEDIMRGFDRTKPHSVIPDRSDAIRYAVMNADDGDTVLLCGKGHENYEITADGMRPFDEVQITISAIEEKQLRMKRRN